ncbi:WLM domain-containing protein [Mycena floridula]|nr:WLM domain-containing protein [Mycena floridula]
MVHFRVNEKEANPNPFINFITPLDNDDDAKQFLRALAAQVRPVMKKHGFTVNSLEEYEFNSVFAGRNWNNGETIELVLRYRSGDFQPTHWLMSTLCHELAHIKHMNHGPAFQKLWSDLRAEVRALQDKGYYGDGLFSAGTRLADSATVPGEGIENGELPEYMCGGAHSRARPTALRRRRGPRRPRKTVASNHTGRQTDKKRKVGARVTSKYAFEGDGNALNGSEDNDNRRNVKGGGFGKQAGSKRAREERAIAAERRIQMLQGQAAFPIAGPSQSPDESSEEDEDDIVPETDAERRNTLLASEKDNLSNLKSLWRDFDNDFIFTGKGKSVVIDLDDEVDCDLPFASGSTFTTADAPSTVKAPNIGLGKIVQTEIDLRKKESLGLAPIKGGGRTLARPPTKSASRNSQISESSTTSSHPTWNCLVCTLENEQNHLACSVCSTPRGDKVWSQIEN